MKREDCRRKTDELFSQKQADVITRRTAHPGGADRTDRSERRKHG